ncbi:MAG: LysM peptidoglycan-binding domain-containing protein [Deltaproteobacteria bacterium]|nr:LysM peptidoglycan-binding domain-containing protein [Candidatus Zymogenaceae bacterium]
MKKTPFILGLMVILWAALTISAQEAPPTTSTDTRVYIIKEGDTLWNISGEVYQDPNKWPVLWELNPQITDPNAISPGEKLILEETKPQVEAEPVIRKIPEEIVTYPETLPPVVSPPAEKQEDFVMEPSDVYYIPKVLNAGFITKRELEDSGTIDHTREEKKLLTDDNIVFIKLPKDRLVALKRGDRFSIFRVAEKIKHPVTRSTVGYAITIVGELEVTSVGAKTAAAVVSHANDIVMIGDRVRPFEASIKTIRVHKGTDPVVGYVVYTLSSEKYFVEDPMIAENDIVYIDRGYADGVQTGNVFDILRIWEEYDKGELTAEQYQKMLESDTPTEELAREGIIYPPDVIGQIVVLKADEYTSTAVVNKSNAEIKLGDMVRLQVE